VLYAGASIGDDDTRLAPPVVAVLDALDPGEFDDVGPWSRWRAQAASDDSIVYFAIEVRGAPVGEIFVHDVDVAARTGMVGYRIFDPEQRRVGVATSALRLLVEWARGAGTMDRLIGIARADNTASCRLLERVGFARLGPAREDPARLVHELLLADGHAAHRT
jgi:RimJ/RimL family protein N-acetyltransferase